MSLGLVGQAAGLFAVTNVDDIVVLALFFGRGAGRPGSTWRIAAGQYLGFAAILALSAAVGFGATFLPAVVPHLGLVPLLLGVRAAVQVWRSRRAPREGDEYGDGERDAVAAGGGRPAVLEVAAVTLANGGDNVGVYVPVFAAGGVAVMGLYAGVFLVLVAGWVLAGRYLASRTVVARARTLGSRGVPGRADRDRTPALGRAGRDLVS